MLKQVFNYKMYNLHRTGHSGAAHEPKVTMTDAKHQPCSLMREIMFLQSQAKFPWKAISIWSLTHGVVLVTVRGENFPKGPFIPYPFVYTVGNTGSQAML